MQLTRGINRYSGEEAEKVNANDGSFQNKIHNQPLSLKIRSLIDSLRHQAEASLNKVSLSQQCGSWEIVKYKPRIFRSFFLSKPQVDNHETKTLLSLPVEVLVHIASFVQIVKSLLLLREVCKAVQSPAEAAIIHRAIKYGFNPHEQIVISQQRAESQFHCTRNYLIELFKRVHFFIAYDQNQTDKEKSLNGLSNCTLEQLISILSIIAAKKSDAITKGFLTYLFKQISIDNLSQTLAFDLEKIKVLISNSISNQHCEIIIFLFSHVQNLNETSDLKNTFLAAVESGALKSIFQEAAKFGNIKIIHFLLHFFGVSSGADQTSAEQVSSQLTVEDLTAALQTAVKYQLQQPKLIRLLVKHGANVSVKDQKGNSLLHLFHYQSWNASIEESIEFLLTIKSDLLHACNNKKMTVLYRACLFKKRKVEAIKYLLDKKIDPNTQTESGHTALHAVIKLSNSLELVKLLVNQGANTGLRNQFGLAPLDYMIIEERSKMMHFFIHQKGMSPEQFLHDIILWQKLKLFLVLLKYSNLDINQIDTNGFSPLGLAKYIQRTKSQRINTVHARIIIKLLTMRKAEESFPSEKKLAQIKKNLESRQKLGLK